MRVGLNRVPRSTRQPLADVGQRDLFRRELSLHLLTQRPVWLQLHRIKSYVFVDDRQFLSGFRHRRLGLPPTETLPNW